MADLRGPGGLKLASCACGRFANTRIDRHFLYLYVFSAFLGLRSVGS